MANPLGYSCSMFWYKKNRIACVILFFEGYEYFDNKYFLLPPKPVVRVSPTHATLQSWWPETPNLIYHETLLLSNMISHLVGFCNVTKNSSTILLCHPLILHFFHILIKSIPLLLIYIICFLEKCLERRETKAYQATMSFKLDFSYNKFTV